MISANPLWVNPGDIYNVNSTVTVNAPDPSPDPVLLLTQECDPVLLHIQEYYSDE